MAQSVMTRQRTKPKKQDEAAQAVADLIAERAGMVQRLDYEPLGRIIQIQTSAGWLQFRNRGPAIARLADGCIDITEPWPGLKDHTEATQELCPDCLAMCDECRGTVASHARPQHDRVHR